MFKTVIATLIIATASVALASKVNAGPTQKYPTQAELNWMDRASQLSDAAARSNADDRGSGCDAAAFPGLPRAGGLANEEILQCDFNPKSCLRLSPLSLFSFSRRHLAVRRTALGSSTQDSRAS